MLSVSSHLIAEALESHQANPIYETGWDTCLPPAIYAHSPMYIKRGGIYIKEGDERVSFIKKMILI